MGALSHRGILPGKTHQGGDYMDAECIQSISPPVTGQPGTCQPVTGQPVTGQPVTHQPVTDQPFTGQPGTGQFITSQPIIIALPSNPLTGTHLKLGEVAEISI